MITMALVYLLICCNVAYLLTVWSVYECVCECVFGGEGGLWGSPVSASVDN